MAESHKYIQIDRKPFFVFKTVFFHFLLVPILLDILSYFVHPIFMYSLCGLFFSFAFSFLFLLCVFYFYFVIDSKNDFYF
jgi:membrane protein YdbS with pleckstrin-like domain